MTQPAPPSGIDRLLSLPQTARLLDDWAAGEPGDGSPFDRMYRACLAHSRVSPSATQAAIAHVRSATKHSLSPGERARLHRLDAHCLSGMGDAIAAAAAYERAFDEFVADDEPLEAGRTTIGWVLASAIAGNVVDAESIADTGHRLIGRRDPLARARLAFNLATAWFMGGLYERAAGRFTWARRRFRALERTWDDALCDHNLGLIAMMSADPDAAAEHFERARSAFAAAGLEQLELYALKGIASTHLVDGRWTAGIEAIDELTSRFASVDDRRAIACLHRELSVLFVSIGALDAALPEASAALSEFDALGMASETALAAYQKGRLLAAGGHALAAEEHLARAFVYWSRAGDRRGQARATVERSRTQLAMGDVDTAFDAIRPVATHLDRVDPSGEGAVARAIVAWCHLTRGRVALAERLFRDAHRRARRYPAVLERPRMAIGLARCRAARSDRTGARRWARRAVDELEDRLAQFGTHDLHVMIGDARGSVYGEAVDVVLDVGGRRSVETAVDLLCIGRTPALIEDLEDGSPLRPRLRVAIGALRDEVMNTAGPGAETRRVELEKRVDAMERRLRRARPRRAAHVRAAIDRRRIDHWRRDLGRRHIVLFDRARAGWRAFVLDANERAELVELPDAERALSSEWVQLRLLFDMAARTPAAERAEFLRRTLDDATRSFDVLRAALWTPLDLDDGPAIVVPTGALSPVPLEALAGFGDVSRLPHPALLRRPARTKATAALVLHGPDADAGAEARSVAEILGAHDVPTVTSASRAAFDASDDPLSIVHVAAHGTFRRRGWLRSGVRLDDGWLGFEQLPRRRLKGSLLCFTSCESGLNERMPGSDIVGWTTAALAAGARDVLLTLWKVDATSTQAFSDAFYPRLSTSSAAAAFSEAREELRHRHPHPYHWAAMIRVGP